MRRSRPHLPAPRVTAPKDEREIDTTSVVVASSNQVSSDLAGETVLLDLKSAFYYGLAGVGSRVWELVREPIRVSEICRTIVAEYDVAPDRCEADVLQFLRALAARELIEVRVGA